MVTNIELIPGAFATIFTFAFTGEAAVGGAIGAAIRFGVARGLFSNEAGLGSAPIAAAAARTDMPGRQALISMTQVFFDTLVICSITGVTIVMSGQWRNKDIDAGALTAEAFGTFLGSAGPIVVAIGLIFFATSTILGWSYYGEKCFQYLFPNQECRPCVPCDFRPVHFRGISRFARCRLGVGRRLERIDGHSELNRTSRLVRRHRL